MHHQHVHYDTSKLTLEQKHNILVVGYEKAHYFKVDVLDAAVSIARRRVDMPFEQILAMLDEKCHFVVIHRRGDDTVKDKLWGQWYLELGFCTMSMGPNHYLWLHLHEDELQGFVDAYELSPML